MEMFDSLEKSMCKELEAINSKLAAGNEISTQDLEKIDKLTHALKSLGAYRVMKEAENCDYPNQNGMSSGYYPKDRYADAYQRGYDAASNMSGYYGPRRSHPYMDSRVIY